LPLTGPYAALGDDQLRGTELAIEQINAEGGVLGKKIELFVRDSQLDGGTALRKAKELLNEQGVKFIGGSLSGAVSRILNEFAEKNKIIYMGYPQSDMVTGEDINKYGFASMVTPYMDVMAISNYAFENLGKKWFSITADYRWGHRLLQAWLYSSGLEGGEFLGNIYVPLGTSNFIPYIPRILAADPDFLVMNNLGTDQTAAIKQVNQFGLTKKMKIVCSKTTILTAKECGEIYDGDVYGGVDFYWKLEDKYESARNFVEAYSAKFGFPPRQDGESGYVATRVLFDAIKRAGTDTDIDKIIDKILAGKYAWTKGEEYYTINGQRVQSFIVLRGKGEKAEGWDVADIVAEVPGEEIIRTPEQAQLDLPNIEIELPK
jgi:branched-chain amino acid transport system substrate-binding protein